MASPTEVHARPLGVAALSIVVMAFGIVTAVIGLASMLVGFVSGIMDFPAGRNNGFVAGLIGLVLGAVYFVAGVGLWNLRPWAWWLAVLAGAVGFVVAFGSPVWMIVWAALVVYLIVVRANFGVLRGARVLPNI